MDYICRQAIIDDLEKEIEAGNMALDEDVWINKGLRIAIRDIKDIKSSDVQRVKHTKNLSTFAFCDEFICENCGIHLAEWIKLDVEDYEEFEFKFCPNCGAKMDGK